MVNLVKFNLNNFFYNLNSFFTLKYIDHKFLKIFKNLWLNHNDKNNRYKNLLVFEVLPKTDKHDIKKMIDLIFELKIVYIKTILVKKNRKKVYLKFIL